MVILDIGKEYSVHASLNDCTVDVQNHNKEDAIMEARRKVIDADRKYQNGDNKKISEDDFYWNGPF